MKSAVIPVTLSFSLARKTADALRHAKLHKLANKIVMTSLMLHDYTVHTRLRAEAKDLMVLCSAAIDCIEAGMPVSLVARTAKLVLSGERASQALDVRCKR